MANTSPKHGLTQHVRGGWYKSVNGVWTLIAGKRQAPTAEDADRIYEAKFASLWGGANAARAPSAPVTEAPISDLFDQFLHAKKLQVASGNLDQRTYAEYEDALQKFCEVAGDATHFAELRPHDFTRVFQGWNKSFGPHRLSKYVSNVRTAFNWLKGNGFIPDLPAYGDFRQPTRAQFRRHQARQEERGGQSMFTPAEIAALLGKADEQLRAAILLAINGGFGNTDLSKLRLRVLDLEGGWIDYRRGKTGVKRRCPLWPETIGAIKLALPLCKIAGNVFSTSDGRPLVQGTHDRLAARFKTLCGDANCYVESRGFYSLRHTFATEAVKHAPTIFVKRVTGHTSPEEDRVLDEHYVGGVDGRLCEMVIAVRHGLLCEWSEARAEEQLPAAPVRPLGRRQGKPRSDGEGKRSADRTAHRRSGPFS